MTDIYSEKTWKSPVNLIYGLLFLTLMISGLWMGRSIGAKFEGHAGTIGTVAHNARQSVKTGQRNILIIGVDDLTSSVSQLRSVWLLIHFPDELDLTFIPLYPGTRNGVPVVDPELEKSFSLDRDGIPSATFFDSLGELVWWDNYIVMDEFALAEGIDFLGGIAIEGELLDGHRVIDSISAADKDLLEALVSQVNLLDSICRHIARGSFPSRMEQLIPRLADHYQSDIDLHDFMNEWRNSLSELSNPLVCEFPTLDFITP